MLKEKIKGFIAGVIVMTLLFTMTVSSFATSGSRSIIATFNDVKLYVNQNLITSKDASGNTIEPFISNGTTYLPVRAVADALGQDVTWVDATKSIYIGSAPQSSSTLSVGQVLMDMNNIKIIYKGTEKSDSYLGGYKIKLQIENGTEDNYTIQVRNFSINGIMCEEIFSCDVAAGKIAIDGIVILDDDMQDIGQTTISSFETNFHVYNSDDWSDSFDSPTVNITI